MSIWIIYYDIMIIRFSRTQRLYNFYFHFLFNQTKPTPKKRKEKCFSINNHVKMLFIYDKVFFQHCDGFYGGCFFFWLFGFQRQKKKVIFRFYFLFFNPFIHHHDDDDHHNHHHYLYDLNFNFFFKKNLTFFCINFFQNFI